MAKIHVYGLETRDKRVRYEIKINSKYPINAPDLCNVVRGLRRNDVDMDQVVFDIPEDALYRDKRDYIPIKEPEQGIIKECLLEDRCLGCNDVLMPVVPSE